MAKLSYWEKRALARQNAYDRSAAKTLRTVQVAYGRAEAQITQDMEKILRSFRENYGLTREQALRILHEPYSREILDRLRAMARRMENGPQKRAIMAELNAAAYKARISRLEAAQLSAKTNMALVADAEIKAGTEGMLVTARDAFDRMMFDLQKESGVMFRSTGMSVSRAREILKTNWSGQSFSRRVWRNTDHVSTVLSQALKEMAMAGKVSDAGQLEIWSVLKKELKENLQQGRLASQRLLMTEWNYVTNQAEKEAMEDCGMEKYQFMAVLDSRTSEICQELDGKIFNLADAKPGVNYPPMHPWCRSLAVAVIDEKYRKTMTRRATDPETGEIEEVPYDMNYREWKEWKETLPKSKMSRMASFEDIPDWPKRGKVIDKEELNALVRYGKEKGIKLDGFQKYDGNVELMKQQIDTLHEVFGSNLKGKKRVHLVLSDKMNAVDYAKTQGTAIYLNSDAFRSEQKLKMEYDKDVKRGWFIKGTDYNDIVVHESGHLLMNLKHYDEEKVCKRIFDGMNPKTILDYAKSNISEYASTGYSELIAELLICAKRKTECSEEVLRYAQMCVKLIM